MKVLREVLGAILTNPIFDADVFDNDSDIVSGTVEGAKVSVIRSFVLSDQSMPDIDVSIIFNGFKVYGYSGQFLCQDDKVYINSLFYAIRNQIDKLREADRKQATTDFNKLFRAEYI